MNSVMPLTSACSRRFATGSSRQARFFSDCLRALPLVAFGEREQSFGRVRPPVEDDILAGLAQLGIDLGIDRKLAGVDDAHIHAGRDGVIEKDRMHGLAHRLVAAKREGEIGNAAGNMDERKPLANLPRGLDEIDAVIVVFVDAGRDRENIRIEDDVLGRKSGLLRQDFIGARANIDPALERIGLALFIEGHHDDGGAIGAHDLGLGDEFLDALLHRDGIDDRLALHAFEAGFDHREFRRIDHHRHARDVGLGGDEVQELDHRLLRIEQAFVHVDVDDLRAHRDLIARDIERGGKIAVLDQFAEFGRARDIGALADIDERNLVVEHERLEPGEAQQAARSSAPCAARPLSRARRSREYASGVVPQQPPMILTSPASANSPTREAIYSGLSS